MSDLSNCCNWGVRIVSGNEGTNYWECSKCEKACDAYDAGLCFICNPHIPNLDTTCKQCDSDCWAHIKEAYESMGVTEDE